MALAALTTASSIAADQLRMPVKAPVVVAPDWTQFYVGGGIGFDAQTGHSTVVPTFGGPGITFDGLQAADLGLSAMMGFDIQVAPRFVVGAFADYDWSRQKTTITLKSLVGALAVATPTLNGGWTVGGRAGILVAPDVLLYGLAGFTEMRLDNWTFTAAPGGFALQEPALTGHGSAVGGGLEYRLVDNLSLRAEYRYVSLGGAINVDAFTGLTWKTAASEHIARVMAAYRFGRSGAAPAASQRMPAAAWTGFYGGIGVGGDAVTGHINGGVGGGTLDVAGFGGADVGGTAMVGYDRQLLPSWVVGVFGLADLGSNGSTKITAGAGALGTISTDVPAVDVSWTVGGRAGYLAAPDTLVYALGGYTETRFHAISYNLGGIAVGTGPTPAFHGATVGGGFEKLFTENVSARAEYRYTHFDTLSNLVASGFTGLNAQPSVHTVRLVLSYRVPTP